MYLLFNACPCFPAGENAHASEFAVHHTRRKHTNGSSAANDLQNGPSDTQQGECNT